MGLEDDKRDLNSKINRIANEIANLEAVYETYASNDERRRRITNEIQGLRDQQRALREDLSRLS